MAKQNKGTNNEAIGADLLLLADFLINEGLCNDISSLNTAGNVCAKLSQDAPWEYELGQLDFLIDEVGSTMPSEATELQLRFSISIIGNEDITNDVTDPLAHLKFDIQIFGKYLNESLADLTNLYCSWHLDRHIVEAGDGPNKFSHPLYHLTFGGNKMEEQNLDYGSALILPSPRIAYPPMDAVLGIDFILNNYFHKEKIKKVITNPDYTKIIRKSQERLWKPYFTSINSKWNNYQQTTYDENFTYKKTFPLLS